MSPPRRRLETIRMLRVYQKSVCGGRRYPIIPIDWRIEGFPIVIHQGVVTVSRVSSDDSIADGVVTYQTTVLDIGVERGLIIVHELRPDRATAEESSHRADPEPND
jgi:hypothetical protein